MRVSTNVKPKKKKSNTAEVFEKAEQRAKEKYTADSKAAKEYDESLKKKAKGFRVKTGRVTQEDLAASHSYVGANYGRYSEQQRVKGLKETGYYDAKPAVVGGTKKMLKASKKNVNKSMASKQAKRSAKKLY